MAGRLYRITTLISAILFALVALLALAAHNIDPSSQRLACGQNTLVSVVAYRWHPQIVFFNDPDGPYRGSIIALAGEPYPWDRRQAFGETAGIYYRYFHWKTGGELWTLSVSMLYPAVFFAILPAIWLTKNRKWLQSFVASPKHETQGT